MNHLNEILLSNIFLILVWLAYELLFSRQKLFQANRIFLVSGSAIAVLLPWLPWQIQLGSISAPVITIPMAFDPLPLADPGIVVQSGLITAAPLSINWLSILYWSTAGFLALVSIAQLVRLRIWARRGKALYQNGLKIVPLNKPWSAFSFFRTIYFPAPFDPLASETQVILRHEEVHCRQLHSLDNLLILIIRILFFYNPVVYLLTSRIRLVHEYIADEETAGTDKAFYSHTLIRHQFLVPGLLLMHSFNKKSFLKRRLTMLLKNQQTRNAGWNYLLALPLISLMILISGWSATAQDQAKKSKEEIAKMAVEKELTKAGFSKADIDEIKIRIDNVPSGKGLVTRQVAVTDKKLNGEEVFVQVDVMPKFQGGTIDDYRNWIQKNVQYPAEAKTKKIQGTVYLSFIVDAKGQVVRPEIIRSADPILDQEVMRALKSSPTWTAGMQQGKAVNVAFTMPIKFILDGKTTQKLKAPEEANPEEAAAMINTYNDSQIQKGKKAFQIVEVMPGFQGGGIKEFAAWAQANVKYPSIAQQNKIQGTVYVAFLVTKEGKVEDVEISRKVYPALDEEVLRVIKSSPDWTPGLQRGNPVHVAFNIPIKFIVN